MSARSRKQRYFSAGQFAGRSGKDSQRRRSRRALNIEPLEDRRLLAGGPLLAGITVNDGTLLQSGDVRNIAPTSLMFSFDNGQRIDPTSLAQGILITRSGFDGVMGNANDVAVQPGFVGLAENPHQVIVRFAESLPDDLYQITLKGSGDTPLRNVQNEAFNDGVDRLIGFELNLAPQVIGIVPQPVSVSPAKVITQARNQIVVYFNNDDLNVTQAQTPSFYQLIFTGHSSQYDGTFDTVNNLDDGPPIVPTSVSYNANTDSAVLTFAQELHQFGVGTYRLRIGNTAATPSPPATINVTDDAGSSFAGANTAIGTLTTGSVILTSAIDPQASPIVFPGSNQDPGHRQVSTEFDFHVPAGGADAQTGITTIPYNFDRFYGVAPSGGSLINLITEAQKQRAREAFELWSHYLGVEFLETEAEGWTIVTGDLRALDPTAITDPAIVQGAAGEVTGFGPAAIMNGAQQWTEEYGGTWFKEAMRQIGSLLGLGATGDLPVGTVMGGNDALLFENGPLGVFPGEHDITHGRYMYRPDSNDIDLYRFTLAEPGRLSAEIIAERQENSSLLDSHLRLYQQQGNAITLIAQNDDYFGNDSLISLELQPGTYFVGVSSKGNDNYDPVIANSGADGTTQGSYDLRLDLRPAVSASLADATGIPLDGDNDGLPGGTFNFWFRVESPNNVLFVEKTANAGGNGSASAPFRTITAAMNAAGAGDIVRVVGNNLNDGEPANDVPYQIGIDAVTGQPLPDGGANGILDVKKGVTLVFDAGTIVKMRRGAIVVGSVSPITDRGGAAIQVYGTPSLPVVFTSVNDDTIGQDINPLNTPVRPGDWGGILIRSDFDNSAGRFNYERQGIFLNYINHGEFRYGGGALFIDSVARVINPVTMIDTRPTVTFNKIVSSADAALAANPDSFQETNFNDPRFQAVSFTADYGRVGPELHGNRLITNTTNGLFVGNSFTTPATGNPLNTSARWNDRDITYIIGSTLRIAGRPGGPVGVDSNLLHDRRNGSLRIDPGAVVKLEGAAIEVGFGATLLAEGTSDRPIVFTSLLDDRYGAGGTFDTNNDGSLARPSPGDWAGIYLRPTASGSFDHNRVSYGGGVAPVEGTFTGYNTIEIHQADTRITRSRFEFNASGVGGAAPANRFGRTENDYGTIFFAGAQPVIVDNVFIDNESAIIYADLNDLNFVSVTDAGRSTGLIDRIPGFSNNHGPLIRNNRFSGNDINGMEVRGGTLSTQGIWDDTDIVHVVKSGVYVPNFHTYGGLQLRSSVDQSLVIKLLGETAGFITTGTATGIPDHVGGTLQVIGQPGQPVIMTSLYDDSVGAGFDTQGLTVTNTSGSGRPYSGFVSNEFQIVINFGPRISLFPEVKDAVRKAADMWEAQFSDPMTVVIDVELADLGGDILAGLDIDNAAQLFDTTRELLSGDFNSIRNAMADDAGDHEPLLQQLPTYEQLRFTLPDLSTSQFGVAPRMTVTTANAKALGIGVGAGTPSDFDPLLSRDGRIDINSNLNLFDFDRTNGLLTYREDFVSQFQREIGRILGFGSGVDAVTAGLLNGFTTDIEISPLDMFRFSPGEAQIDFRTAPRMLDPRIEAHVFYSGENPDFDYRSFPLPSLQVGEIPLATGFRRGDELNDFYGAGFWRDDLHFRNGKLTVLDPVGVMDPRSRLRDEVLYELDPNQSVVGLIHRIGEADRAAFDAIGYNAIGGAPGDWQGIRVERLSHDGNVAVALEVETEGNEPATNGSTATAQFLGRLAPNQQSGDETLRLGFEIHGLLNRPSDVDVYSFQAIAGTRVWFDLDQSSSSLDSVLELVNPDGVVLARSNNSLAEADDSSLLFGIAEPFTTRDIYSTNLLDAGMQLVLPGTAGTEGTYHVRVRSNSPSLQNITGGVTSGRYQMQVRLQAEDEVPGVSVSLADIRFADVGVHVIGPPTRSPLGGEQAETYRLNDTFAELPVMLVNEDGEPSDTPPEFVDHNQLPNTVQPQFLGNVLASRQGAISLSGKLATAGDVDWYRFTVSYNDLITSFATSQFEPDKVGLVFDLDYADGIGRPDTAISVYDSTGTLLFFGDDSNVELDQPTASPTPPAHDLSRGSFGTRDPFIGPVVVDAARDLNALDDLFGQFFAVGTYYVAVTSAQLTPFTIANGSTPQSPILGDPNRGFSVTGSPPLNTQFVENASAPTSGIFTGEYQFEVRTVPIPTGGFNPSNATLGDSNRKREQGHIAISSNQIRDSRTWGVAVEDGLRDFPIYLGDITDIFVGSAVELQSQEQFRSQPHAQFSAGDYVPYPGVPRALPNLNEERLLPGITVANNLISGGGDGGIQLAGDPGGIVLNTYNFGEFADDLHAFNIDNQKFTIWDNQRRSITFSFNSGINGDLIIRADEDADNDNRAHPTTFVATSGAPTRAEFVANEIEHAIRLSNLDVKVYRGDSTSLFVEGAVEIGQPDVVDPNSTWSVFRPDKPPTDVSLPLGHITAEFVQQSAVPYTRVVNNTLFGRAGSLFDVTDRRGVGDIGILVEDNSSPTLLNNIVANFAVGIKADATSTDLNVQRRTFIGGATIPQEAFLVTTIPSEFFTDANIPVAQRLQAAGQGFAIPTEEFITANRNFLDYDSFPTNYLGFRPTVIGGTVYQGNLSNTELLELGAFPIVLNNSEPLFVDPSSGNFFLAPNSRAIDSSVDQLSERPALLEVMNAVGLHSEGIKAPSMDVFGVLRVDDPAVEPPTGFGHEVFKDRGAVERADFVGPIAELVQPVDNSTDDLDPSDHTVAVFGQAFTSFQIRLSDRGQTFDPGAGSGTDPSTVTADVVRVFRNEVELTVGIDYVMTYDATASTIRLTPTAGVWDSGTYRIQLDNQVVRDRATNLLLPNRTDGTTQFVITVGEGFDFGDAPATFGTLLQDDGARHRVDPALYLGDAIQPSADGRPSANADADPFDDGVDMPARLFPSDTNAIFLPVTASRSGTLNAWLDLNRDGVFSAATERIVTNFSLVAGLNSVGPIIVPASSSYGNTFARFRFSSAGNLAPTGAAPDGEVEDYPVQIGDSNWQNPVNPLDVDGNGIAPTPIDALLVINELTSAVFSDPVTGELPTDRLANAPFLDVNGDGYVSPIDALLVINQLPSSNAPGGMVVYGDDESGIGPADGWLLREKATLAAVDEIFGGLGSL